MNTLVKTSYSSNDVVVLLKDLTNVMVEQSTEEREQMIQSGVHYSEMLPKENKPSDVYMDLYTKAVTRNKKCIAHQIEKLACEIVKKSNDKIVIVSLARAGIPVGILLKHYIEKYIDTGYESNTVSHYAISIIRDKGIDINAMNYIYEHEINSGDTNINNIFFVDGWTGKGVIKQQLNEAVQFLKQDNPEKWNGLSDDLYVLADPANVTPYCATRDDYLLPSACLNSTVSGLLSRTILNSYIDIESGDFHGAVYFTKFEDIDLSNNFISIIDNEMQLLNSNTNKITKDTIDHNSYITAVETGWSGTDIVNNICEKYGVADYKKVKPGIGETTRVLLRRVPWKVLINKSIDKNDLDIAHIFELCEEKNIPIEYDDIGHYKVCGIIKDLSADA